MLEFYPQIKQLHIWLVSMSGLLFALRGAAAIAGMRWPRAAAVRYGSYTLDTFLLTSAAMLVTILPRGMFANGWLTVKLLLVVIYIVLGIIAMRSLGQARRGRGALFYLLALATFAFVIGIAWMHAPWGWLTPYLT